MENFKNLTETFFNTYFLNNNRLFTPKRKYFLELDDISESHEGNEGHKKWLNFLEDNPHIISNFDNQDSAKVNFLFRRWKIFHNNG